MREYKRERPLRIHASKGKLIEISLVSGNKLNRENVIYERNRRLFVRTKHVNDTYIQTIKGEKDKYGVNSRWKYRQIENQRDTGDSGIYHG